MKTPSRSLFTAALSTCIALASAPFNRADTSSAVVAAENSPTPLEVHEWGTFTVLQGSDGQVIEWYQAPDQLVDLPPFVRRSIRVIGKNGAGFGQRDTVRMETPVLYFYPEQEMDVTVRASFPNGRITEVFPPAAKPNPNGDTVWHGSLLAPDSPERKKVPAATGPRGRHYAAAREVPDAWLFQNKLPPLETDKAGQTHSLTLPSDIPDTQPVSAGVTPLKKKDSDPVEPIEHFIFYRGAGRHKMYDLRSVQDEGSQDFTLSNYGKATIPKIFAIRIADGQTGWQQLDSLAVAKHIEGKTLNQRIVSFPEKGDAIETAAIDLRRTMIASLHSEGLTRDEAIAMVNTWDNLWFTEPGTRFLAILPQQFADDMVPLTITPTPRKIDRVFVARIEIISREKEQELTSLLTTDHSEQHLLPAAARLADLQLGRYAAGGMERALTLLDRQMRDRFSRLSRAAEQADALQATTD